MMVIGGIAGCGSEPAKPSGGPDATDDGPTESIASPEPSLSSGDITMSFYEYGPTAGGEQLPSFTIRAADFTQGAESTLSFVDADAEIFTEDGVNLRIEAGSATMDETNQRAMMGGGAVIRRGTMVITLENLDWNNEKRLLVSDQPVRIRDGETVIDAAGMEYRVDENRATLKNATGRLYPKQGDTTK